MTFSLRAVKKTFTNHLYLPELCFLMEKVLSATLSITFIFEYGLFSKNVPNFLMALNQTVLQDIKNPLRIFIQILKSIEFHQPHYEIPQLSPC